MCTAYKPCIIVSLFGCVMNYCNLAKCVTIYELYSLSNDMNETCLSCIEQNQIVLIVCQIPKIVQTAFVWSRDFLLQTKHGWQWPGGPPLWLEQVLVEMNLIPDLQSTSNIKTIKSASYWCRFHNPLTLLSVWPPPSPPSHRINWMLLQILGTWCDN